MYYIKWLLWLFFEVWYLVFYFPNSLYFYYSHSSLILSFIHLYVVCDDYLARITKERNFISWNGEKNMFQFVYFLIRLRKKEGLRKRKNLSNKIMMFFFLFNIFMDNQEMNKWISPLPTSLCRHLEKFSLPGIRRKIALEIK